MGGAEKAHARGADLWVVTALLRWTRARRLALFAGFVVAFALRLLAVVFDWRLPRLPA